ncbi:hypothetical protein [Chloroflexus sp.]|uniref:hypothetical protein n=1 Tax=Chloroflexus sp. TaxID=1904827 RepID=UPI0026079B5A|nr:hypothetical protein [uncultured Chloroflexus sp.]
MIVHFSANTAPFNPTRAVILWTLAFLIGPWPALACIIHCLYLPDYNPAGIEHFLCSAPHPSGQHETSPPPVRYEMASSTLALFIGFLIVVQRLLAEQPVTFLSFTVTPEPPPPRTTLPQPSS